MSVKALQVGMEKVPKERMHLDEATLMEAEEILIQMLTPIWGPKIAELVRTYEECVALLNLVKSPGFPWNVDCMDKLQAMLRFGPEIQKLVEEVLALPNPADQ